MAIQRCCIAHKTKNAVRTITSNIIETGILSKSVPQIPLGRSTLCALSLAPCSPLKPPNDTPRPEELNQVMMQSRLQLVWPSSWQNWRNPVHRCHAIISFAPPLCELQQHSHSQVRQFSLQKSRWQTLMKSPKIHRVLVYTDKEGIPGWWSYGFMSPTPESA